MIFVEKNLKLYQNTVFLLDTIPAYLIFGYIPSYLFFCPKKLSYSSKNAYIQKLKMRLLGNISYFIKLIKQLTNAWK